MAKLTSESFLKGRGIGVPSHLPELESDEELSVATHSQIAKRIGVLSALIARSCGAPRDLVVSFFEASDLREHASANEKSLVERASLTREEAAKLQQQVEGMWELAWALDLIPQVDQFKPCGNELAALVPKPGAPLPGFEDRVQVRPTNELIAEADLLYRIHWSVRDCALNGRRISTALPAYITEERRRAIEWILHSDTPWEDVDMST